MSSPTYKATFDVEIESNGSVGFAGPQAIVPNQPYPWFVTTNETRDSIQQRIIDNIVAKFNERVQSESAANGIRVWTVTVTRQNAQWVNVGSYTAYQFPLVPINILVDTVRIQLQFTVITDAPYVASPMPLWVMQIIKWAFEAAVLILVAYFVTQAIQNVITGLFVKTTTTIQYNPDGTIKESSTTTEPTLGGWVGPIVVLILAAAGGYVAVQYFGKKPRGRKRAKK